MCGQAPWKPYQSSSDKLRRGLKIRAGQNLIRMRGTVPSTYIEPDWGLHVGRQEGMQGARQAYERE